MKILMLNPPFLSKFSRNSRSPAVTVGGTLYYPIWLSYATGVLEKFGFDLKLLDAPADGLNYNQVSNYAKKFSPDLIVVDTSTPSIISDIKVANNLKNDVGSFVTLVGTHVSALPEETLKSGRHIDAVVRGEYDYTIRDLAKILDKGGELKSVPNGHDLHR